MFLTKGLEFMHLMLRTVDKNLTAIVVIAFIGYKSLYGVFIYLMQYLFQLNCVKSREN